MTKKIFGDVDIPDNARGPDEEKKKKENEDKERR